MDRGGLAEAEEGGDGEDGCELHIELLVRLDSTKVYDLLALLFASVLYDYVQSVVYGVWYMVYGV